MLRRNGLIADRDVQTLREWMDCLSYAVMMLLESSDLAEAFAPYDDLCEETQQS